MRRVYAIPLIIATLIMAVVASGCTGVGRASTPTLPLTVKYTETLQYCNYHSSIYYEKNISIPLYTASKNITVESYNVTMYVKKCHNVTVYKKGKIYVVSYPLYALKNTYPPKDSYSISTVSPKKDLTPVGRVYYIINPSDYGDEPYYYAILVFNVSALAKYNVTSAYLPNGEYSSFGLRAYKKKGVQFIIIARREFVASKEFKYRFPIELGYPYEVLLPGNIYGEMIANYTDIVSKYAKKTRFCPEGAVFGGYTVIYYKGKDITDYDGIYKLDDGTIVAIYPSF